MRPELFRAPGVSAAVAAAAYVPKVGSYAAAGTDVLTAKVTGDTVDRFILNADGKIEWGPGNGAVDTNLYRSGADQLKTDDSLLVGTSFVANASGTLSWGGDTNLYRSAADTLKTDDTFQAAAVSSSGVVTAQAGTSQQSQLSTSFDGSSFWPSLVTSKGNLHIVNALPPAGLGSNGDVAHRTDTPGTALQRIYVKAAGAWVGIL